MLGLEFDANVGCESCSGGGACTGATGNIGNVGNLGCKDCGSCVGIQACSNFGYYEISYEVFSKEGGSIGVSSCVGELACASAFGTIGDESCLGVGSCIGQKGTIGDKSCTKGTFPTPSCFLNSGIIGDGSCTELGSCTSATEDSKIGNDSW